MTITQAEPASIGAAVLKDRSASGKERRRKQLFPKGGWGGIRTHETLTRLPVFKTGAFDHSATHPDGSSVPRVWRSASPPRL